MTDFQISLTHHAISDLEALPPEIRARIRGDLESLEGDPFPSGTKIRRLKTLRPPVYRLRSGEFRVLYLIERDSIVVLRIIDRKLLDRIIGRLKLKKTK